jgi:hypothetical protein
LKVYTIVEKICKGPKYNFSATSEKRTEKISKPQQTLKNTKYIHFFHNLKHIKQQQHQINTLAHKYRENTNKYDVMDAK